MCQKKLLIILVTFYDKALDSANKYQWGYSIVSQVTHICYRMLSSGSGTNNTSLKHWFSEDNNEFIFK